MRRLSGWQQVAVQFAFVGVALFVFVPLWGLAQLAFDGAIKGWPIEFRVWPKEFTFAIFQAVWEKPAQTLSFLGLLKNSLIVSGGASALAVVLGASMAYAFARFRFPARRAGVLGLLFGTLLPPVALMTPLYILLTALGVRTTLFGLMIVYTAFAMPFCVWNMRAAFQAVPKELEESAFLDGATQFETFRRVTLPLALPAIAVAALIAFLAGYTEFAMAWLFVDKSDNVTLAMAISGMVGQFGASWNHLAALALLMSVPVVLIFLLLQQYMLSGLWVGAVEE
jgi:arabinogalactan oligomer/maltooligosaccharide transport system permease protein